MPGRPFARLRRCLRFITLTLALGASAAQAGDLVLAQVAPLSGPAGAFAEDIRHGVLACIESVNARGGIAGARLRLVSRGTPPDAQATVEQFVAVARAERPLAFIFPVGPAGIAALIERGVAQQLAIPLLGTLPAMVRLREPLNPFVFHLGLGEDAELVGLVRHVAGLGTRRIGVLARDDPAGREALALVEREARARGLDGVVRAVLAPGGDQVAPAIEQFAREQPGAVIAVLPVRALGALVKGLRAAGQATPVYGLSHTDPRLLVQVAGAEAARGVGLAQVVPNPFSSALPLVRDYQQDLQRHAAGSLQPSALSLQGYVAARVLVEALRRAGPAPTPASLRDALETLHNVYLGGLRVHFDADRHVGLSYLNISAVGEDGRLLY